MKRTTNPLCTAVLLAGLVAQTAVGAETDQPAKIVFRLGAQQATRTDVLDPSDVQVVLLDLVPGKTYYVNQVPVVVREKPPSLSALTALDQADGTSSSCRKAGGAVNNPPEGEKDIPAWLTRLDELLASCKASAPAPTPQQLVALEKSIAERKEASRRELEVATISEYRGLRVTVERQDSDHGWELLLLPPSKHWFVSYGFQALPDEDESFFLAATNPADDGSPRFVITPQHDTGKDWGIDTMLLFSHLWDPPGEQTAWRFGVSGGLGLEDGDLGFFLGPSVALREFLFLTVGAAFHPQQRLTGSLEPGQVVTSTLTDAQLHQEKPDFNWFIGLSFSFDKNPFKSSGKGEEEKAEQPKPKESSSS